jgi:hypothetical protein
MKTGTHSVGTTVSRFRAVALSCLFGLVCFGSANGQFSSFPGQMNLPQNDFTWTWGNQRSNQGGPTEISMFGNDSGFRCDLNGKMRIGSRVSRMDLRSMENDIRGAMSFITAATYAMNDLDGQRALEWATLKCVKPQREERRPGMGGQVRP